MWSRASSKAFLSRNWLSFLVIAVAGMIQMWIISKPLTFLLVNVLPDDAFYYFQIARNAATGHGVSFDGVELTNGFHPLWMMILIPIYAWFSTGGVLDLAPIHSALQLSVVFNVITAGFVLAILSRFTESATIRAFALVLWALNPFVLFESVNGLETALALMLTSAFMFITLKIGSRGTLVHYALLGILAGFMTLARLDMVFYFVGFLGWLLLTDRGWFKKALIAGSTATLILLPWFAWNYANFGMLLTSASQANTLTAKALIVQDNGDSLFQWGKAVIYNIDGHVRHLMERTGTPAFILAAIGAALVLLSQNHITLPRRLREITVIHALFFGFSLLFLINVVIRFGGRTWYFVTFGIFVSLLFTMVANQILPRLPYRKLVVALTAAFVVFTFYVSWSKEVRNQYLAAQEIYAATVWANENLPEDAIIGSFNSGIHGYFTARRVVNLDGLVNNAAYEAMRRKELWRYIEETGITHIIDYDIYLTYRHRSYLGIDDPLARLELLHKLAIASHSRSQDGISVYALKGK